jgi:hypothetical protein
LLGSTDHFQWWHTTLLADAFLTFFLFLFSDAAPARIDAQMWSEPFVASMVSISSFLRGAFAVLTITRFFWLALLNVVPPVVRRSLLTL